MNLPKGEKDSNENPTDRDILYIKQISNTISHKSDRFFSKFVMF